MVDPICGNCGRKQNEHFQETQIEPFKYCNLITNGDVFTDDPSDSVLMDHIRRNHKRAYDAFVRTWKNENGHQT